MKNEYTNCGNIYLSKYPCRLPCINIHFFRMFIAKHNFRHGVAKGGGGRVTSNFLAFEFGVCEYLAKQFARGNLLSPV